MHWAKYMYVYTPQDIMMKVINRKRGIHIGMEELDEIFNHFPYDRITTYKIDDTFIEMRHLHHQEFLESL